MNYITRAQKIQLYKDVQRLNSDKELIAELNDKDETVYSLGILETQDVAEDVYHNNWA